MLGIQLQSAVQVLIAELGLQGPGATSAAQARLSPTCPVGGGRAPGREGPFSSQSGTLHPSLRALLCCCSAFSDCCSTQGTLWENPNVGPIPAGPFPDVAIREARPALVVSIVERGLGDCLLGRFLRGSLRVGEGRHPNGDCHILPTLSSPTASTFKAERTLTKNRFTPGHQQKTSPGKYLPLGEQVCGSQSTHTFSKHPSPTG